MSLNAQINREINQKVKFISGLANHSKIVQNDLRLVAKIVENMDKKWMTWLARGSGNGLDDDGEVEADTSVEEKLDPNPYLTEAREYLTVIEAGSASITTVPMSEQSEIEMKDPSEEDRDAKTNNETSEDSKSKITEEETAKVADVSTEKSNGNKTNQSNGHHHNHNHSELSNDELVLLNEDDNLNLDMDENSMNGHSATGSNETSKKSNLSFFKYLFYLVGIFLF